jgi:hypothetical protein
LLNNLCRASVASAVRLFVLNPQEFASAPVPVTGSSAIRYIGYFQKNEFDGWTFPHYDKVGQEIDEWWNPDKIFSMEQGFRVPLSGIIP